MRIGDLIRRGHIRAEGAGLLPVFTGGEPGVLPVAYRTIHIAAVTRDVAERIIGVNSGAGFTNDYGQLTFIIKLA